MPTPAETGERLSGVLRIVYLIFNEGYAATGGEDWARPGLCREAMRLGRVLTGLLPREAEVHGLLALMELQASRLPARVDAGGQPVLLPDQDRRRWDRALIRHGLAALATAERPGRRRLHPAGRDRRLPRPRRRRRATDWPRIAGLYEVLAHLQPTPVVRLNRAVAVGFAGDPARGLRLADELVAVRALQAYPQLPAVRAELLARLGRPGEARAAFAHAAELTRNEPERALFRRRADEICSTA